MDEEPISDTHMDPADTRTIPRSSSSGSQVMDNSVTSNTSNGHTMEFDRPNSNRSDYSYSSDGDHTAASEGSSIPTGAPRAGPESLAPPPRRPTDRTPVTSESVSGRDYSSDSDQATVTEGSTVGLDESHDPLARLSGTEPPNASVHQPSESRSGSQLSKNYYSSDSDQGTSSMRRSGLKDGKPARVTGSEPEALAATDGNSSRASSRQSQCNYSTDSDQATVTGDSTRDAQKEPQRVSQPQDLPESESKGNEKDIKTSTGEGEHIKDSTAEPARGYHDTSSETSLNSTSIGKKKAHFVDAENQPEKQEETYVPSSYDDHVTSDDFVARSKRQNSDASMLSQSKPTGRRHSGLTRPTYNTRPHNVRHYSTMSGGSGRNGQGSGDNVSVRSTSSRNSGFCSIFNYMTERFIYETDPFEGALKKCPRLTFHVVDKAMSPVSIEILFGNPERRALPSYYYTSTGEKNTSARSRRGTSARVGSRQGSVSPPGSVIDARNYPPLDSLQDYHRDTDGFILEEEEENPEKKGKTNPRGPRSGRAGGARAARTKSSGGSREGTLPDIYVSDHTQPASPRGHPDNRRDAKRPVTSWSNKTNKSVGLPGKPIMSS